MHCTQDGETAESKWGEKPVGCANYVGIKHAARRTQWCTITTREVVNGKSVFRLAMYFVAWAALRPEPA